MAAPTVRMIEVGRAKLRDGAAARSTDRFCDLRSSCGPSWSLLPVGGGSRPAAGYSGCRDPGRVSRCDERKPGFRVRMTGRALGRTDDQALAAASDAQMYVPLWRIGFLVPPAMLSPAGRRV